MFPIISRVINEEGEQIQVRCLTESLGIVLDRNKCIACGTCSSVCPKGAIIRGPIGAFRRFSDNKNLISVIFDPNICVFCGICVYFCPFSALTLKNNGKTIELNQMLIIKNNTVPTLAFENKKLENGRNVRQYAKGTITIDSNKCVGGCSTCLDICPSGAIEKAPKPSNGWEISSKVKINQDKCVFCGACDNACPSGAIRLNIKELMTSGEYNESFLLELVKRLNSTRSDLYTKKN